MLLAFSNDNTERCQGSFEEAKAAISVGNENTNVVEHRFFILPNYLISRKEFLLNG